MSFVKHSSAASRPIQSQWIPVAFALLFFALLACGAGAQSQSGGASVADAARRAREQKKNAAKPARTLTNDDLPAAEAAKPAADEQQAKPGTEITAPEKAGVPKESSLPADSGAKKKADLKAALKRAKAELAQAQRELDVLQRRAGLDSESFYSQTDYAHDAAGKAKLDANTQQINDKKSQVDDLTGKVAALQAEIGEADTDQTAQPL